jgi:hypothetical protein
MNIACRDFSCDNFTQIIDNLVDAFECRGYGVSIGENKKESYDKLPQALSSLKGRGDSVFIQVKARDNFF